MHHALIGLGSNLGDRAATLDRAAAALAAEPEIAVVSRSGWHETAPVGGPLGQGAFLNGTVVVETTLEPESLLDRLQQIETRLGRQRGERWAARTLDLDLLLYDDRIVDSPRLTVPHPRMAFRRFVLAPAAEVAGTWRHPRLGWKIDELLAHVRTAKSRVALVGPSELCRRVAEAVAGSYGRVAGSPVEFVTAAAGRPDLLVTINTAWPGSSGRAPCPVLQLKGDNLSALRDEIVAAVAAMQG
ncbi:MAG TPA: 2-amino-4-hydroxy-6-hydroxymethyldihydropteridine diphosphokinase [Pirellulales bacterium]|jgi:2-amino-4-hydroxy-6-hydroxymethyldihydropteridine diphosphokinase|nr:2-amino-4-hydroxy-6-hydroxymethyldihydropteridine diphosphokinase [Pirellulales bacterium]